MRSMISHGCLGILCLVAVPVLGAPAVVSDRLAAAAGQRELSAFLARYPVGSSLSGEVHFGPRAFPLPPGHWTVMVRDGQLVRRTYQDEALDHVGAEVFIGLFQHANRRVTRWLEIRAPIPAPTRAPTWHGLPMGCMSDFSETLFAYHFSGIVADGRALCWESSLQDRQTAANTSSMARKAVQFLQRKGFRIPAKWVSHHSLLANAGDYVAIGLKLSAADPEQAVLSSQNWQIRSLSAAQTRLFQAVIQEGTVLQQTLAAEWGLQ